MAARHDRRGAVRAVDERGKHGTYAGTRAPGAQRDVGPVRDGNGGLRWRRGRRQRPQRSTAAGADVAQSAGTTTRAAVAFRRDRALRALAGDQSFRWLGSGNRRRHRRGVHGRARRRSGTGGSAGTAIHLRRRGHERSRCRGQGRSGHGPGQGPAGAAGRAVVRHHAGQRRQHRVGAPRAGRNGQRRAWRFASGSIAPAGDARRSGVRRRERHAQCLGQDAVE